MLRSCKVAFFLLVLNFLFLVRFCGIFVHFRLCLEKSATAAEAIDEVTRLINDRPMSNRLDNSDSGKNILGAVFIIADRKSVWLLEVCGSIWVAILLTGSIKIQATKQVVL